MATPKIIETHSNELQGIALTPRVPSQISSTIEKPCSPPHHHTTNPGQEFLKKSDRIPNILPHGDLAGKPDHVFGLYETPVARSVWEIDITQRPYLSYLKSISEGWPHITWLADFMEVGTSPLKWKFLAQEDIEERAKRTRVAILDFSENGEQPTRKDVQSSVALRDLFSDHDFSHDPAYARLIIVEDLSRDVIETLGAQYDIDPLFFRSQVSDYLWYKTEDAWVELNDLDHVAAERNFFNIRYMRPRYFTTEKSIDDAKEELGTFNVLRRLEQDLSWRVRQMRKPKGATVGVVRSKTSLWLRRNKPGETGVLGILVVDPTLREGYPLWDGPRNLQPCPSMHEKVVPHGPPRTTLFEDVIHYVRNMSKEDMKEIKEQPRALGITISTLVATEWKTVVSYIITGLTQIEWELEHEDYRDSIGLEGLLDRLHPLRRLIPVYHAMVDETLNTILNATKIHTSTAAGVHLRKLNKDFESILDDIKRLQIRTQNIISLATTIISMEENARAMKMNKNLVRVTYLAVVFAPMAFVSSFFSMTPNLKDLTQTIWVYFAVTVPLTILCLGLANHRRVIKLVKWLSCDGPRERRKERKI